MDPIMVVGLVVIAVGLAVAPFERKRMRTMPAEQRDRQRRAGAQIVALLLTAVLLILVALGITGLIAGRTVTAITGLGGGVLLSPLAVMQ